MKSGESKYRFNGCEQLKRGTQVLVRLVLMVLLVASSQPEANAQGLGNEGKRQVTVMTRNLYVGADFSPIVLALYQGELARVPGLVSAAYAQILASDFPTRAQGIAGEIRATAPELISLQEVSLIRTQFPGFLVTGQATPATDVALDYLQILLAELELTGLHYVAVCANTNLDVELPNDTGMDVRLTDRDVILARADLPRGLLSLSNPQSGNFAVNLQVPVGSGALTVYRGWCSVDVFERGRSFRFLNTHLDDGPALIREAQAAELLSGPANVALPVLMAGDFNTDANGTDDAYPLLIGAGLLDSWSLAFPDQRGDTCCQTSDLQNANSILNTRIDLILFQGQGLSLNGIELTGADSGDRISSTFLPGFPRLLWPSDHAGLVATIGLR